MVVDERLHARRRPSRNKGHPRILAISHVIQEAVAGVEPLHPRRQVDDEAIDSTHQREPVGLAANVEGLPLGHLPERGVDIRDVLEDIEEVRGQDTRSVLEVGREVGW
jgi:hypothetical protein